MFDLSFAQLPDTTRLNRLPLVITEPGEYVTRDGHRVTIHSIVPYVPRPNGPLRHAVTAFEAKGTIWRKSPRTGRETPDYNVWHLSGSLGVFGPSSLDIVGRA